MPNKAALENYYSTLTDQQLLQLRSEMVEASHESALHHRFEAVASTFFEPIAECHFTCD